MLHCSRCRGIREKAAGWCAEACEPMRWLWEAQLRRTLRACRERDCLTLLRS